MADVAEVLLLRDPGGDPDGIDTGPTSLVKTHSGNAHTAVLIAHISENFAVIDIGSGGGVLAASGRVSLVGIAALKPN